MGLFKKKTFLGKLEGKPGNIFNPFSMLSDFGAKDGPANPYGPPDPSGLLKVDTKNSYMDEIMKPYSMTAKPGSFYDFYKPPTSTAGDYFDKYVGSINAPSSVDAVRGEVEGDRYQQTLRDIARGTDMALGRGVKGYMERGIAGDGNDSDITRVGLAQIAGQGQEAAARAGLDYRMADLQRLAERESALRAAYGEQYRAGVQTDSQMRDLAARAASGDMQAKQAYDFENMRREDAQRQLLAQTGEGEASRRLNQNTSYYQLLADLFTGGETRKQAGEKPSYLDDLLRNVNVSLPIPV